MKKHFNKNLIMSEEEEYLFQQSNSCWICKKLINHDVRAHCHVTGKFRGAAHWSCNINFLLSKKIPVIFDNLKGYNSHPSKHFAGLEDVFKTSSRHVFKTSSTRSLEDVLKTS